MKALFAALRDWDTEAHGTVLSTHMPAADRVYDYFDPADGDCDLDGDGDDDCDTNPNQGCCKFKRVLEVACGAYRMTIHQTHGNIHLNWYLQGSLPFLRYFFKKYDSPTEGFYMMDIQYVFNAAPAGKFLFYNLASAVAAPDFLLDWLLDPLVSRHITIGSHIGALSDGLVPDPDFIFGENYAGWNDYWNEIFRRMWDRGKVLNMSPEATCEAIQNISHGNAERLLRIPALPGFGCGAPEMIAGLGTGSNGNPSQVRGYRFDGVGVTPAVTAFTAYGTGGYGVNVGAGLVDAPPARDSTIFTAPGPGPLFGPQVRGWFAKSGGIARAKLNWFAYGTLRNWAKVTTADLDGDGIDDVVTTPVPGWV